MISEFDELSKKRKEYYWQAIQNGDRSHQIIAEDLYSDPTHFLFELMQNAEDEGATKVSIDLNDNGVEFFHNGNKFSLKDIESITMFGNNDRKKFKSNSIGRFGIGFKSVFAITEKPEIHSGSFHFNIEYYIIPSLIDERYFGGTKILLPFKDGVDDNFIENIKSRLESFDYKYILFLSSIKNINLNIFGDKKILNIEKIPYKESNFFKIDINIDDTSEHFLLIEKIVDIEKAILPVKIAYKIVEENEADSINPIFDSPVYTYFPTDKKTNLSFLIHAPFETTASRDNIKANYKNETLINQLVELFKESVFELKNIGLLNLQTWACLPIEKKKFNNPIYTNFYSGLKELVSNQENQLIPVLDNVFTNSENVQVLYKDNEVINEILTVEEKIYFFSREFFIHFNEIRSKIGLEKTNGFIDVCNIGTFKFFSFCFNKTDEFFEKLPDEKLVKIYALFNKYKYYTYNYQCVSRFKCIRTTNNEMVKLFDWRGNPLVYLPDGSNSSDFHFVKEYFLKDPESKEFFKNVGVKKPDNYSRIIELIIPRLNSTNEFYHGYLQDIEIIVNTFNNAKESIKSELFDKLSRNIAWLPGKNYLTDETIKLSPEELYFPNENLLEYFKNIKEPVYFLDLEFSDIIKKHQKTFIEFGIYNLPRRFYYQVTHYRKEDIITYNRSIKYDVKEKVEIEGLKNFMAQPITFERSILLWNILLQWRKYWTKIDYSNSNFIQILKSDKWLYDENKIVRKPQEISISTLHFDYEIDKLEGIRLDEALGFYIDAVKEFEKKHNGVLIPKQEYENLKQENEVMRKKLQQIESHDEENENIIESLHYPDFDFVENAQEAEVESFPLTTSYSTEDRQINKTVILSSQKVNPSQASINDKNSVIGQRGEEFVLGLLKREYHNTEYEVVNLNSKEYNGVGCDFLIKKNQKVMSLIEVKATKGDSYNNFLLSELQFSEAIKAHNQKSIGYYIYCVYNVLSSRPDYVIINDPIEWILKNKLRVLELPFRLKLKN
ncbi:MAG: hypothetical protein K9L78_05050 [Victivallales bacterium]|nr:hypothetical protein [Victivallales bacterium]